MYFKKDFLITTCHNKLRDGVTNLSGKAFNPSYMRDDPLGNPDCAVREVKTHPTGLPPNIPPAYRETSEKKGGILIHDL